MKKILMAILAISSISAFADIGDTPYTAAQQEKLTQSSFDAYINSNDGYTVSFNGQTGVDADSDGNYGKKDLPFISRGRSYGGVSNKITWLDYSGSNTEAVIMNRFRHDFSRTSNVPMYAQKPRGTTIAEDGSERSGYYFLFWGDLTVDGTNLGQFGLGMRPINGNDWIMSTTRQKYHFTTSAYSTSFAVKSDDNRCFKITGENENVFSVKQVDISYCQ